MAGEFVEFDDFAELSGCSSIESVRHFRAVNKDIPRASLLGLPAKLREKVYDHVLAPYNDGLRVICCSLHMGPMHSTKAGTRDDGSHHHEIEMVSRVKTIMRVRTLHTRLNAECTAVLRNKVRWNFCISLARHPNQFSRQPLVRYLGREAFTAYSPDQLHRLNKVERLMKHVKNARIIVDLPCAESDTVAGRLKEFEGVDSLRSLMSMLMWQRSGVKADIHFRYGSWASSKEEHRPDWSRWQMDYLSEYLKALQHVPDQVALDLHFEYIGDHSIYGARYNYSVVPALLTPYSFQEKLAEDLMTLHRSRHMLRPPPTLLSRYMVFREWLCSEFVFIHVARDDNGDVLEGCNRWLISRDFRLAEEFLAAAVERVWRAHANGNVEEFEKAKLRALYARDEWSSKMAGLLMEI